MNGQVRRWSRRGWLRAAGRYLAAGGIGLLCWNLLRRSSDSCWRATPPCQDCRLLAACRLPPARHAKSQRRHDEVTS